MPGKVPRLGARSPPGGRGRLIGILRLRGISMGIRIDHLKKKFNPKLNPIILEIVWNILGRAVNYNEFNNVL